MSETITKKNTFTQTGLPLTIELSGPSGNAFYIMGQAKRLMQAAGSSLEEIDAYLKEAMSSDYDHLLETTRQVVELETV